MSIIYIDPLNGIFTPGQAKKRLGIKKWSKINDFDQILEGPPLGRGYPFRETEVCKAFHEVFVDGRAWPDTDFFQRAAGKIRSGQILWRCNSPEELLHRLETDIRSLFDSMKANGYLRQREIRKIVKGKAGQPADDAPSQAPLERFAQDSYPSSIRKQHEIKIGLNEAGEVLFLDGRHRLSIAMVLGMRCIPVQVVFRHRIWHDFREHVRREKTQEAGVGLVVTHPDLPERMVSAGQMAELGKALLPARPKPGAHRALLEKLFHPAPVASGQSR